MSEFGKCDKCKVEVDDILEVGYLGPMDRSNEDCDPFVEYIVVCKECESFTDERTIDPGALESCENADLGAEMEDES